MPGTFGDDDRGHAGINDEATEREREEAADEVHKVWMDAVADLCVKIGVDPKSFDWSPGETTEETVGNIVGKIADRFQNGELLNAARIVLAGLDLRIRLAPPNAVPVFNGIAELHCAIEKIEQYR
jgi:hypothetical protein